MPPTPKLTEDQQSIIMLKAEIDVLEVLLLHANRQRDEYAARCRELAGNIIDLGKDNGKLRAQLDRLR
jgi:hypothetical protein